jgi:hypothetical protein
MPEVVTYRGEWRDAFERLNREWIETWFALEEADRETFRDPAARVLAPGGQIFFVVDGNDEKHGFVRVPLEADSRYARANIKLERLL